MNDEHPQRAQISRRVALAGGSAGLTAALLAACGAGGGRQATTAAAHKVDYPDASSIFADTRTLRFVVVCHELDAAPFVPLQYGLQDACTLLGCRYDWTGSRDGQVQPMVRAIDDAVSARVDGIATTLIEAGPFNAPVKAALAAGIPVLAYNSDVPGNPRMAYIGSDLQRSGELMGQRLAQMLPAGGPVTVFASAPGSAAVEPRMRGIRAALNSSGVKLTVVATGSSAASQSAAVQSALSAEPRPAGVLAIDAGSTEALAQAVSSKGLTIPSAGVDATQATMKLIQGGQFSFSVQQQPYLQGFLAILELYLYRVSQKLVGIADADTGLQLVAKDDAGPFIDTISRFQGTSSTPGVQSS